jgi:hypothetical protein
MLQTDAPSQLLAVLIIVYRLRNNLFHGLKTLWMLNDQIFNLDKASRTLAAIVKAYSEGGTCEHDCCL